MEFITIGKLGVYVFCALLSLGIYILFFRKATQLEGRSFRKATAMIYMYITLAIFFPVYLIGFTVLALFIKEGHHKKKGEEKKD